MEVYHEETFSQRSMNHSSNHRLDEIRVEVRDGIERVLRENPEIRKSLSFLADNLSI